MDKHLYKGWLNSDFYWKRMLAIVGYQAVFTFIVWGIVFVIAGFISIATGY